MTGTSAYEAAAIASSGGLWLEDLTSDRVFALGQCVVAREDIIRFASLYDPQPFHVDEEAARATLLKGLAASGWHTCALSMRLLSDAFLSKARYAGLSGVEEIKWLLPVRPGDRLTGRVTCLGSRPMPERPDCGLVDLRCEAFDRHGQRVMWWLGSAAFLRRCDARCPATESHAAVPAAPIPRQRGEHGLKFFEDVAIREEYELGSSRFSGDDIAAFCREFDPVCAHPAAQIGGPLASGWHVASVWMQKLVRYYEGEGLYLRAAEQPVPQFGPSPGIRRILWHRPVYEGDTLAFTTWIERKLELPHPDWGMVIGGAEARNQRGEVVISFTPYLMLERRAAADRCAPVGE